jgi:cysteine-rich repeat protein
MTAVASSQSRSIDGSHRMRNRSTCQRIVAIALLLTASGAAPAVADEARTLRTCTRRITRATLAGAREREKAISQCIADTLACTTAAGDEDDVCADAARRRCRARLARLEAPETRAVRAVSACAEDLQSSRFLGVDGLGYSLLAPFCPRVPVHQGSVADALACQRRALGCTADRTIAALAPRTAEVLARIGVSLDDAALCLVPYTCGNGLLDLDEECDFGTANSDTTPNTCRTSCLAPYCGDHVVDEDEDCDDGNTADGDGCDADCFDEDETCGDGVLDEDEDCDDGNLSAGDGCDEDCFAEETSTCGDGIEDDDEECDDGAANSDVAPDHCRTDCKAPSCGDGVVDVEDEEACEPPGSLLCTEDCELRLEPPVGALPRSAGDRCAGDILKAGLRMVRKTRTLAASCVQAAGRCVLGRDGSDRCLADATRRCEAAADRHSRLPAAAVGRVARACVTSEADAPMSLATFLDAHEGLGMRAVAARCPFAGTRRPTAEDLLECVFARARCLGERAVAETVPRASELLFEVLDNPETAFPCVLDPTDLEPEIDFGSPKGAFLD